MADDPLRQLLSALELESLPLDVYRGDPGPGGGRLFGGLVAAQSVMAAAATVAPERPLHSLHAYFLRPGRHGETIRFEVERVRDGGSFTTRRVRAKQAGQPIFELTASFCLREEGISHQDPMPEAPPPQGLPDRAKLRQQHVGGAQRQDPVEIRLSDPHHFDGAVALRAYQRNWLRIRGDLPQSERAREALLVYASDQALMSTVTRPHRLAWHQRMAVSLDHSLWIHRPVDLAGWLLYVNESPVAHAGRGLVQGALYYPDGRRLASVTQEVLVRRRRAVGTRHQP